MSFAPGTSLGPYKIIALIGSGGMGEVYRARDTRLLRDVALKVLVASLTNDPDRLRRFEQEAVAALNLSRSPTEKAKKLLTAESAEKTRSSPRTARAFLCDLGGSLGALCG